MSLGIIFLTCLLGVLIGTISGLLPGIHANLFAAGAVALLAGLSTSGLSFHAAIFLYCLALTQSLVDIIPAVFLCAPDEESCIAVLPGTELMRRGFGLEAVRLWVRGCLVGILVGTLLFPLLLKALPWLYDTVRPITGWLLLFICISLVWKRDYRRFAINLVVFLLSGLLGIIAFTQHGVKEPVFPLMSGLFGCAGLIIASSRGDLPEQYARSVITLARKTWVTVVGAATIASLLLALLPGIGRSQASAMSVAAVGDLPDAGMLSLLGMVSSLSLVTGMASLISISKARDGALIVITTLLGDSLAGWEIIHTMGILAGSLAAFGTLGIARWTLPIISALPERSTAVAVILLIAVLVLVISGVPGILVLLASTALGVICPMLMVERRMLLGCLLVPVILYWFL